MFFLYIFKNVAHSLLRRRVTTLNFINIAKYGEITTTFYFTGTGAKPEYKKKLCQIKKYAVPYAYTRCQNNLQMFQRMWEKKSLKRFSFKAYTYCSFQIILSNPSLYYSLLFPADMLQRFFMYFFRLHFGWSLIQVKKIQLSINNLNEKIRGKMHCF